MELGTVVVVGIGADGLDGLAPRTLRLVESAELLCGGARHLAFFREHAAEKLPITGDLDAVLARLRRALGRKCIVVLASGDPLCFGIGARLVEAFGAERVRVLPHPSAIQLAFARLGVPWHGARLLSAHGRDLEPVVAAALGARTAAILTDGHNTPSAVAEALLAAGMEACQAAVLERLGAPDERVVRGRLDELAGQAFDPLNVLVLLRARATRRLALGLPERAYAHRGGMITKAEVRAVALSKLGLRAEEVVWDVGAGCGSLAIEAASLVPDGRVYAIERDPDQLELLRQNCRRHLATNVEVVAGQAPIALRRLPDPEAVFVGGHGGQLAAILRVALRRLVPGGRLVLNAALLETLLEAERLCRRSGWATEVSQVAVARGEPTAGGLRLAAQNPIFVLGAWRLGDA